MEPRLTNWNLIRRQWDPKGRIVTEKTFNVLFLCTGNSARSQIAESLINRRGAGKFRGYSAGSHPAGEVNPFALRVLEQNNFSTEGLRSKSWDEFAGPDAPRMDFVFTLCDGAAGYSLSSMSGPGSAGAVHPRPSLAVAV